MEETGQTVDKTFLTLAGQHGPDRRSDHARSCRIGSNSTASRPKSALSSTTTISPSSRPTTTSAATTGTSALCHSESTPSSATHTPQGRQAARRPTSARASTSRECLYFKDTKHAIKLGFKSLLGRAPGRAAPWRAADRRVRRAGRLDHAVLRERRPALEEGQGRRPARARQGSRRQGKDQHQSHRPTERCAGLRRGALLAAAASCRGHACRQSPGPQQGTYKEVVVSISQQYMWAYEDGVEVIESWVSTGTAETPEAVRPRSATGRS